MLGFLVEEVCDECVVANWGTGNNDAFGTVPNAEFRSCDRGGVRVVSVDGAFCWDWREANGANLSREGFEGFAG